MFSLTCALTLPVTSTGTLTLTLGQANGGVVRMVSSPMQRALQTAIPSALQVTARGYNVQSILRITDGVKVTVQAALGFKQCYGYGQG